MEFHMKAFILLASLLFSLNHIGLSKEKVEDKGFTTINVKSDKGTEVQIKNITSGILKKKAKGKRFIMSYTTSGKPVWAQKWHRSPPTAATDIPVINGYHFGFYVTLADLPKGETVIVEVVDTLPGEITVEGKKATQLKQVYRLTKVGRQHHLVTTFSKKEHQLMKTGAWKKELFCNGKLIHTKVFNLVKPSDEEAKRNEKYEEYMKNVQGNAVPKKKN